MHHSLRYTQTPQNPRPSIRMTPYATLRLGPYARGHPLRNATARALHYGPATGGIPGSTSLWMPRGEKRMAPMPRYHVTNERLGQVMILMQFPFSSIQKRPHIGGFQTPLHMFCSKSSGTRKGCDVLVPRNLQEVQIPNHTPLQVSHRTSNQLCVMVC
jgi:hypothetical protein